MSSATAVYCLQAGLLRGQEILGRESPKIASLSVLTGNGAADPVNAIGMDPAYLEKGKPYRLLVLPTQDLETNSSAVFPQGQLLLQAASAIFGLAIDAALPNVDEFFARSLRQAFLDAVTVRALGISYWLDFYRVGLEPLLDGKGPLSVELRAQAFGHLLWAELGAKNLALAMRRAKDLGEEQNMTIQAAFLAAFIEISPEQSATAQRLWRGWLDGGAFDPEFEPAALGDQDGDGVPNFLEKLSGLDPSNRDSDGDGWSDLAELVLGTGGSSPGETPAKVVPDGNFGDWQELLPKRLFVDKGKSGLCPKAADINFYGALATSDLLLIGAVATEFWPKEASARWEIDFDFPLDKRQILGVAKTGAYTLDFFSAGTSTVVKTFRRATQVANRTFEFGFNRQDLQIQSALDLPEAVKIRLRTVYEDGDKNILCDETGWFTPYLSAR